MTETSRKTLRERIECQAMFRSGEPFKVSTLADKVRAPIHDVADALDAMRAEGRVGRQRARNGNRKDWRYYGIPLCSKAQMLLRRKWTPGLLAGVGAP
ncbi:MAG: hypothetical protein AAGI72_23580 [Pseudomonadota bacterium]